MRIHRGPYGIPVIAPCNYTPVITAVITCNYSSPFSVTCNPSTERAPTCSPILSADVHRRLRAGDPASGRVGCIANRRVRRRHAARESRCAGAWTTVHVHRRLVGSGGSSFFLAAPSACPVSTAAPTVRDARRCNSRLPSIGPVGVRSPSPDVLVALTAALSAEQALLCHHTVQREPPATIRSPSVRRNASTMHWPHAQCTARCADERRHPRLRALAALARGVAHTSLWTLALAP